MTSADRLQDKVAIVVGAGSRGPGIGNGRAAAVVFARHGAKVLLMDRDRAAAEDTLSMIEREGGEAAVFVGKVTEAEDCRRMVAEAVGRWGRLDILHNNVGIGPVGTVLDMSEESWDRVLRVNVTGMMLTSKAAVPVMRAAAGGAIVNISSIGAMLPRGLTAYSTSKGAVIALTKAMAVDHAKDGIRVNCIAPGPVYTPMIAAGGMSEESREKRLKATLLETEGTAWDVANAALFLASDEARWITGVVLPVDGGALLKSLPRD